jgi:hypothetical protein
MFNGDIVWSVADEKSSEENDRLHASPHLAIDSNLEKEISIMDFRNRSKQL